MDRPGQPSGWRGEALLQLGGWSAPALWDRFEVVELAASLDGSGRRGEYLRKGQNWQAVLANRKRLRAQCPRVLFGVAPTVSVFNALHLPDFVRDAQDAGLASADGWVINTLSIPDIFSIQVLPAGLKRVVAERYESEIEGGFLESLGPGGARLRAAYRGLVGYLRAADLSGRLSELRRAVEAVDRLRGESVCEAFPEISSVFRP